MKYALLGYSGFWGKKFQRVLAELEREVAVLDSNNIELLEEFACEAAIIATPPATHYDLAMRAMQAGMDVLVEKPMTLQPSQAQALADYAEAEQLVLSVDSTFLHTAAFSYLHELDEPLLSYQSIRLAPPMPQAQIPAGWDLIVHDVAILHGLDALGTGIGTEEDSVAMASFGLPSNGSAFIMASRCWPTKVREIVLHFPSQGYVWALDGLRTLAGDIVVSETIEPLKRLLSNFEQRCKNRDLQGLTDGRHGYSVVNCLAEIFPTNSLSISGRSRMGGGMYHIISGEHLSLQDRQSC